MLVRVRYVVRGGGLPSAAASVVVAAAAPARDTGRSTTRRGGAVRPPDARWDVEARGRGRPTRVVVRWRRPAGWPSVRSRERREVGIVRGCGASHGALEGMESLIYRLGGEAGTGALEVGALNVADIVAAAAHASVPHGELIGIRAEVSRETGDVGGVRVRAERAYGRDHPAVLEQVGITETWNGEIVGAVLPAAPRGEGLPEVNAMGERDREGRCVLDLGEEEARASKAGVETGASEGGQGCKGVSANAGEVVEFLRDAFNHVRQV